MSKKKNAVCFTKPAEPAFLRRIKEQIGYKEGPDVDTKRGMNQDGEDDDLNDRDDEKPTVVTLKPGDLTQEEAEGLGILDEPNDAPPGKIKFQKPTKRPAEDEDAGSSKKKATSTARKVKNKSLLSFDDEEEDDED